MKYAFSFLAVIVLVIVAGLGCLIPGMEYLFAVALPYLAFLIFVAGFVFRVLEWAKVPVPFSIQTSCGQAKSLDFIKHDRIEAPHTSTEVVVRMFLEIVLFRSLFRNSKAKIYAGPHLTFESHKWLWLYALMFHYSFLVIIVRHLRLFLNPVPSWLGWIEFFDGIFQVGAPTLYVTDITILIAVSYLFLRRIWNVNIRYISLVNDYFPLVLIFTIALTGILMRYFIRGDIDIITIKKLAVGLATFHPLIEEKIGAIFYIHIFLVSVLLVYFPFSKLMHMGGIFMSPTRNMKNNSRQVRHINPWNPEIRPHSYAAYEDEFREHMIEAGIPVEKQPSPTPGED